MTFVTDIFSELSNSFSLGMPDGGILNESKRSIPTINPLAKVTFGGGCPDIRTIIKLDPSLHGTPAEAVLNGVLDYINNAAPGSPFDRMKRELFKIDGLYILFKVTTPGQVLVDPSPVNAANGFPDAAQTGTHSWIPNNFEITFNMSIVQDPLQSSFAYKSLYYLAGGPGTGYVLGTDIYGFVMHELGHVFSNSVYPPVDIDHRTEAEVTRTEAHAQRWEAHYYRYRMGLDLPFSGKYKYFNDRPYTKFVSDFSIYNKLPAKPYGS